MRGQTEVEDAILSDVSDAEPEGKEAVTERPKSPRELAMEALEESQLRALEELTGVKLVDDADKEVNPEVDDQLEAQLAPEGVITNTEGRKVRVKIDGVEQDIDLADAIRGYQKGSAADKRLEEATRLLREAEERSRQQAPAPVAPVVAAPEPVTTPEKGKPNLKEAFEKLYLGDSDDAISAIMELVSKNKGGEQPTQTPALSIDAIAEQLQQRLAVDTALATVRTDYPDIIANKDIELLTAIKVDQKVAAGASRATAIIDSAKEIYETLGKKAVSQGRPADPPMSESKQEKLKRKANLDPLPTANVADADAQTQFPETPSALIQEMAGRRIGHGLERM